MHPSRVLALGLCTIAAAQVPAAPHGVRVEASDVGRAAASRISPALSVDYGSFLWMELEPIQIAALQAAGAQVTAVPDAGEIRVPGYRFDPVRDGAPPVAAGLRAIEGGPGFRLIQLVGPPRADWLADLEAAGLPMLQYYPHHAYLTWCSPAAAEGAAGSLPFVRWQGPFHPAYKVNADLRGRSGRVHNVDVMFYDDGAVPATLDRLTAAGATILQVNASQPDRAFFDAIVELDASRVEDVAAIGAVLWLGYASPVPGLEDEMSDQIVAGNHPGGVPVTGYQAFLATLGFDGSGVIWSTTDTGVDYNHPDFAGRIAGGYSYPGACNTNPGEDCSGGGHGTHVTGIIGGDAAGGFTDPGGFLYGLGVAPGYSIFAQNPLSASAWPPSGGWQEMTKRAVLGSSIGANNSWTTGEGTAHGYQASERTHDFAVRDANFDTAGAAEPLILVFSAGNSGPGAQTLTAPKEAKNLIVIAASRNYRVGSIGDIASFSSRGPAVDGRTVPNVTAPGEQIASARNDLGGSCSTAIAGTNNLYAYCSGTSMAAPHASGTVAVITEWWRSFNAGANPSPAMAKALLVNGAVDMTGPAVIPNTTEGWGRINLPNVVDPAFPTIYRDQIDTFDNTGEQWTRTWGVANPGQPLKLSVVWADAPGAVGANPALVNNLDLRVVDGVNTYRGNVFSGGWSVTGGSADTLNNVENVFIQSPGNSITITIDATAIAGDGVPLSGDTTDQDFAIVCNNCVAVPDFTVAATPASRSICAPANATYTVDVGSILGFGSPVTLSATGNPAGTTVGFGSNPVTPPGSTVLTIGNTGAAAPGTYNVTITGTSGVLVHSTAVSLTVASGAPGAPPLLTPANGAPSEPLQPTFTWTGSAQPATYTIEIATDPAFVTIVQSATGLTSPTFTPATPLAAGTPHYWRVRGTNGCGTGPNSAVFTFTTTLLYCVTANLAIPDAGAEVSHSQTLPAGITLSDLNVSIVAAHTWVGDIRFRLTHVATGTSVTFFDRPGVPVSTYGCSGNDVDATLDDAAGNPVENECGAGVPTIDGTFSPNSPLSAFNGENIGGTWTIYAQDFVSSDVGTLVSWCLIPAGSSPCPTITLAPATLPNGTAGAPYSQTITASGGAGPYTFAVTSGTLPPGLTLASGGVLSGTPTAAGSYGFTVTATDGNLCTGVQAYTLVIDACGGVLVAPATLPDGTVGAAYSQTVTASGGTAPYTFAVTVGALPTGLSLASATGVISGTPTAVGSYNFTVTATDAASCAGSQAYTVAITTCPPIALAPATLPNGTLGAPYSQTVTAAGGTAPYTYTVFTGTLPTGLGLGASSGVISGTPTSLGTFGFTIEATDAVGCAGRQAYTIVIGCATIVISPATLPDGIEGIAYAVTLTASGGTPPYTYAVTSGALPLGLALGTTSGAITGTPTAAGTSAFVVTATDAGGCQGIRTPTGASGRQSYGLTVLPAVAHLVGEGLGQSSGNNVRVFTRGGTATSVAFAAYGAGQWGTNVASGDVNGAIYGEILTGPGPGAVYGPQVRGFDRNGNPLGKINYYAYGTLAYGVNVSAAELEADGFHEILTGAGPGAVFGPHVRGWNFDNATLAAVSKVSFFAYGTLKYGVNVVGGDADRDTFGEILTGPGPGTVFGAQVRGFNYDNVVLGPNNKINFFAYAAVTYGVNLAGGDADADGYAEIATVHGPGASYVPTFLGWNYDGAAIVPMTYTLAPFTTAYGGRVGEGDASGNGHADLLTAPGRDPAAPSRVEGYNLATGAPLPTTTFQPFATFYGTNVVGGALGHF